MYSYKKMWIINFIYLIILELTFKMFLMSPNIYNIFYTILFTLPISMILSMVMSLFKNTKINKVISIVVWAILLFVFTAETVYFSFYKTICGLSALSYGGQVMEFFSSILIHVWKNILVILVYFVSFIALMILEKKRFIKHNKIDYKYSFLLLFSFLSLCITSLSLKINTLDANNLLFKTNDLLETTNAFGVNSAIISDAIKTNANFVENIEVVKKEYTKEEGTDYNITDIDFSSLKENETDDTIKSMHTYFESSEPSNKNKYTGIFAGKNLIFIVAEGFYPIAVDETLTPTLYKLVNHGFKFNNYYQPIYNCSTSDGEFINQLSILPGVSTCSMKSTDGVYLPYNMGLMMGNYGYNRYAFHGWTYTYYNRDKTIPNLGYTYYGYDKYKKGYKYALSGIKDSWPTSDIDVVNSSYGIYSKDERFLAYYMSISGHLEYNFSGGNAMSTKNKDLVKNVKANNNIKAYIASQIEFDRSLEILMSDLERDGLLDDTVIVISADHYPYGLSNDDIRSYVDWMKDDNFDLYKNNLIIYNPEYQDIEVDKYTSSLDLLPTLLNMFGVKYDSRLLIGRDIFSESDDLVIFNNKSWITSKGRYNYPDKKFEPFTDDIEEGYVDKINEMVKTKFQMSKLLISKDYYRKVLGG